jgi:gamma-glutamyltranspeptidase/glutathione hydrolase
MPGMLALGFRGVVAAEEPNAALTGLKVLEEGGNAFDASIAVSAMLSVTIPYACGLGGDSFVMIVDNGRVRVLNGSGRSSRNISFNSVREMFGSQLPKRGPWVITIPGLVDSWLQIYREFCTMPLRRLLQPAINMARNGFPVGRGLARAIELAYSEGSYSKGWAEIFLRNGKPLGVGDIVVQSMLADILDRLVDDGLSSFYNGSVAKILVDGLRSSGCPIDYEDFASHRSEWVSPIEISYRGFRLYEVPPNSQGITTLMILNVLEEYNIKSMGYYSSEHVNTLVNAFMLAYEDRDRYVADPLYYKAPIDKLLSKSYASSRRSMMSTGSFKANIDDTTFFIVADRWGNIVGFIQSLFYPFGSLITVNGVTFQCRGLGFSLDENSPNRIDPCKRPLHTLSILGFQDQNGFGIIGCAGGDLRPQIHAQILSNIADFNMNIAEAVDAPRIALTGLRGEIVYECRIPHPKIDLQAKPLPYYSPTVGLSQALYRRGDGLLQATADPRSDGIAIAIP